MKSGDRRIHMEWNAGKGLDWLLKDVDGRHLVVSIFHMHQTVPPTMNKNYQAPWDLLNDCHENTLPILMETLGLRTRRGLLQSHDQAM